MDIVTDLTAEAVAYLSILQDIYKSDLTDIASQKVNDVEKWKTITETDLFYARLSDKQSSKISEIVWYSKNTYDRDKIVRKFFKTSANLLQWLAHRIEIRKGDAEQSVFFNSPFFWRQQIRDILFQLKGERTNLAEKLEYMPVQIILASVEKGISAYDVRLYQVYEMADDTLISDCDRKKLIDWWSANKDLAHKLLTNDMQLLEKLKEKEYPLPFETLFTDELNEITLLRTARQKEFPSSTTADSSCKDAGHADFVDIKEIFDPVRRAANMQLMGLALSGGGIRTATFNLGIIQKLASLNALHHFDYLSTVSGGGYVGSWLNSWIMRSASIKKVSDRLSPNISGDPMADEVRPIRWLRMFSNYLTPNVGIMSPDAWASGMTWIRNALVNQFILLLVLLSVLSLIIDIFNLWTSLIPLKKLADMWFWTFFWSICILLPGSLMASIAMRTFDPPETKASNNHSKAYWEKFKLHTAKFNGWRNLIPHFLVLWGAIFALLVSTWFCVESDEPFNYVSKLTVLLPFGGACFICIVFIAFRGSYHKRQDLKDLGRANVIDKYRSNEEVTLDEKHHTHTLWAIWVSSFLAAVAAVFFLSISWIVIQHIMHIKHIWYVHSHILDTKHKIILVIGIPLILEVLSLTVIVRMVIMGNLFPDYRREWWGRIGGLIHRFVLIWLLISSASLIMPEIIGHLFQSNFFSESLDKLILFWGGWTTVIGLAVKKAFESKQPSTKDRNGSIKYLEIFISVAPYLFMLGFLLIGSWIIIHLRNLSAEVLSSINPKMEMFILTIILAIITLALSSRVGVNEFSLHHFYRNRLIRAYLGASRSRTERKKTANSFTGFDTCDDLLLCSLHSANGYVGPYPIINTTLNATVVSALDRQDRMAESFMFTPLYCGYDFSPTRPATYDVDHVYEYGYRPTQNFSNENGGPTLGTAMAISGAAVNPNWGYHSSPAIAFLLTIFNVRLGWWIGNPRLKKWKNSEPKAGLIYLIQDLVGKSDINTEYVCLSDGGHFDNMGLYELIRRRCSYILVGDAEQDDDGSCEGFANAIRRCRIDFGVEIIIDIKKITSKVSDNKYSTKHVAKGEIIYPGSNQPSGTLIYIKTVLTGNEPVDVREYAMANPTFPQQSTGDQFFDEAQFESYRKLGFHSIVSLKEIYL